MAYACCSNEEIVSVDSFINHIRGEENSWHLIGIACWAKRFCARGPCFLGDGEGSSTDSSE